MTKNQSLYLLKKMVKIQAIYEAVHSDDAGHIKYKITGGLQDTIDQLTKDVENYMRTPSERKKRKR